VIVRSTPIFCGISAAKTVHASTMLPADELGLGQQFAEIPHRSHRLRPHAGWQVFFWSHSTFDFSRVPGVPNMWRWYRKRNFLVELLAAADDSRGQLTDCCAAPSR